MATYTATRATIPDTRTITFRDRAHRDFYLRYLPRCRCQDVYHQALVYCLGIDRDTRTHIDRIYDIRTGCIKTECLHEGWLTGTSAKVIRMAMSLYCGGAPSVFDYEDAEERLQECQSYTPADLFCCSHARYLWEAVRIRYPEYCSQASGGDVC